ncbi:pentatricopeptide repeat-containing protein, partial [Tanacetum coccineum]
MGVGPDCFTLPHVPKACGGSGALIVGRAVHGQVFRRGFERDVFVQNGVVAVYAMCGRVGSGRSVFEGLGDRATIVSWTNVISGCAKNGEPVEALRVFRKMRECGLKPDWITL